MERLIDKKVSKFLLIACFGAYLINTTVKMCVPTVISSMVDENFLSKSQSGLLSGIFYLFYGIGQILFGKYFNDHSPYRGVKLALIGSAMCCVLMALTTNFYLLLTVWCICAVMNAGFFPAIMKIASFTLCQSHSIWASKYLTIAYQAGTVFCLVAGGIIMKFTSWVNLYYFAAVISLGCFIVWFSAEKRAKSAPKEPIVFENKNDGKASENGFLKRSLKSYIGTGIFLIASVALFNQLLNGTKSWAPTIIMETYNTEPSFSVLLNIVLIATNIIFLLITGRFIFKNPVKALIYFELAVLPISLLLNFTSILNEYTYVLLLGLFTSVSTYVSNVLVIQVPYYFQKYNDVSRISGLGNMAGAFGLLIGNYAYGLLAEKFGWEIITILGTAFVFISILILLLAAPMFKKFIRE